MASKINSATKQRLVSRLMRRDGNKCFWCGLRFVNGWHPTLDHVVPRQAGGKNHPANLRLSCGWCNGVRGHVPVEEWLEIRLGLMEPTRVERFVRGPESQLYDSVRLMRQ